MNHLSPNTGLGAQAPRFPSTCNITYTQNRATTGSMPNRASPAEAHTQKNLHHSSTCSNLKPACALQPGSVENLTHRLLYECAQHLLPMSAGVISRVSPPPRENVTSHVMPEHVKVSSVRSQNSKKPSSVYEPSTVLFA